MDELVTQRRADRRRNMTPAQLVNLQLLELIIARYRQSNLRMARGLEIGFRRLEQTEGARPPFVAPTDIVSRGEP